MTAAAGRVTVPHRSGGPPGLVAALAVTQTVGYGVLYYAFAVVLHPIAAELRTSVTVVTGALTLAVLVTGVAAIPVGRWLDRHGGRGVMTAGSVLGTASVIAWSQVHTTPQLYAVFAAIGVASAMVLYEPAFAVLVAVLDPVRRARALLAVTIVAGFASSIFIPLTGFLVDRYGWRTAVLVLGVLHAVTIPLHAGWLRNVGTPVREPGKPVRTVLRDPGFWLLTTGFVVHSGGLAIVAVHLVSYLVALGHPPALAAAVTGLLGVLSVTGRVVTTGLSVRLPVTAVTAAVFTLQGIAIAALPLLGRTTLGAVGCVVGFGLGFGVGTIARPAILADRYGPAGYATVAGTLATPATVTKAGAPLAAAALAAVAGYPAVMAVVAAACIVAAGCLVGVRRRDRAVGRESTRLVRSAREQP